MPIAVELTVHAMAAVVQTVPIGTNIALMHLVWVMVSGSFLQSRGEEMVERVSQIDLNAYVD